MVTISNAAQPSATRASPTCVAYREVAEEADNLAAT